VTKRVGVALALGLVLAGCGLFVPGYVQLATGDGPCYTSVISGLLVADPTSGTAIIEDVNAGQGATRPMPVVWPSGFTGRRVGSEVEVLDWHGNVAYTTGQHVALAGGGEKDRGWLACGVDPEAWSIPEEVLLPLAVSGLIGTILVMRVVLPRRSFAPPEGEIDAKARRGR